MNAAWIAEVTEGELAAPAETLVTSVTQDSRQVVPGALYLAFPGERVDGHDFVAAAVVAGASLALVSQTVDYPHIRVENVQTALGKLASAYLAQLRKLGAIAVIGITGSNGKTTTKDLLAQILPQNTATHGNLNNEIGVPLTILTATEHTRFLILEMGADAPGNLTYLTELAPLDVAVVLMVGSAHAGNYATANEIAAAKAEIFSGLRPGGIAVLNRDDPAVVAMAESPVLGPANIWWFATNQVAATVRASALVFESGYPRFEIKFQPPPSGGEVSPIQSHAVRLALLGAHQVGNALAAATVALALGQNLAQVCAGLAGAEVSAKRMQVHRLPQEVTLIDDSYNAAPESMAAAVQTLSLIAPARRIAVLGAMLELGEQHIPAHLRLGHLLVRLGIEKIIVVGAAARVLYDATVREGSFADEALFFEDLADAAGWLRENLQPRDTVLLKGSHGTGIWRLAQELLGEKA